jgi:hypothetical protein
MNKLQFCFYAPSSHVETVKNAVFMAGAGKIGNYNSCSWQTVGVGQFIPEKGSNPTIGIKNNLTTVSEVLVQIICEKDKMPKILQAFIAAHPYEEPAYYILPILTKEDF